MMLMKRTIERLLLLVFLISNGIKAQKHNCLPKAYLKDSFPMVVEKAKEVLSAAYMAEELIMISDRVREWEGFPVHLYKYNTDVDIRTGQRKKAYVYLLNPSPEKLAMWVATTCWVVKKSVASVYTDQLLDWIKGQSGAQFPVRGIVYEDQYVKGHQEPYLFKDGVTVYARDSLRFSGDKAVTDIDLKWALSVNNEDLKRQTGQYARICSTTREDYLSYDGSQDVGTADDRKLNWLKVVRKLYQQAWNSDFNILMIMWARQHLQ